MERGIMTQSELKELLSTPEYQYKEEPRHYIKEFEQFNKWAPQEVYNLFDSLTEAAGGIPPNHNYYIDTGVQMTKEFWHSKSPKGRIAKWQMAPNGWTATYLQWSENMEKAIRWRLSRMYQSMLLEYSALTITHEILPEAFLFNSKDIDLVFGVDLVVVLPNRNKIVYIHVVKESSWMWDNLKKKASREVPMYSKHNTKHMWQRSWGNSHLIMAYDFTDEEKTEEINGNRIFKEDYFETNLFNKLIEGNLDTFNQQSEFSTFHNFLKDFKIKEDGISGMLINSK